MKYLCVIPARGGSKRIPRKNVKSLCGKALVSWTIEAALESKYIDKVVVSTDDKTISAIADTYGVVVHCRPDRLSGDGVGLQPVIYDAFCSYSNFDAVVVLHPTSPIRINNLVDKCIRIFDRYSVSGYDELVTGYWWSERPYPHKDAPSQLLPKHFYYDGNVKIVKKQVVMDGKDFGNKIIMHEIKKFYNHELDTDYDWLDMECRMKWLGMVK
jgi:CMP-N-acetylneuraminic acid synthetase